MSSKTEQQMTNNERLAIQALDNKVANLDELTKAKLSAARLNALAKSGKQSFGLVSWFKQMTQNLGVTGSLATSFSVLAIVFVMVKSPSNESMSGNQLDEELALMAMMTPELTEDPDMLEQLEFIAWLEQEGQGT